MLHFWPQFLFLAWYAYEYTLFIVNAGKPKPDYNIFKTIGWGSLSFAILFFGGFFHTIRLAQMIYIFLTVGSLVLAFFRHGQPREDYHPGAGFMEALIGLLLVGWGGFFHGFGIH